jgi:predicted DCC family thiol-disulfide oxidoreductase YuxK
MRPIHSLVLVYDAACGLCTFTKAWIAQHTPLVQVDFLAAGSPEARRRFPGLPAGELAVVADTGDVWLGNHAWIVCLWALQDYRDLAVRLTSPLLLLMAREAFAAVSRNRAALSGLLGLRSEREMEQQLRKVHVPKCQTEAK